MQNTIHSHDKTHCAGRPTFSVACWLLGLLAFAQLISVGAAITLRDNPAAETASTPAIRIPSLPIQPRSLEDILASFDSTTPLPSADGNVAHDPPAPPLRISAMPLPEAAGPAPSMESATSLPVIADPVVERLVHDSRALQMDGDMMRAMLKLDEAGRIDPGEPAVSYHKALLFEEMGLMIEAADQFQKVQQMGIKAGVYFKLAANKLTKGMDVAHARRPVLSIGPMKMRNGKEFSGAKSTDVTITILARPDQTINPADVHVQVHFYDKLNGGEIKKASDHARISTSWGDSKLDWQDPGNEETLQLSYSVAESDLADEHLLGRREFYGYVVELLYKGEVIDQQALPRRLNSLHSRSMAPVQNNSLPWLPYDSNHLLPGKEMDHGYGDDPTLPPLPRR